MQNGYLVRLALTFPKGDQWWKPVTKLPAGSNITIQFSTTPQTTMSSFNLNSVSTNKVFISYTQGVEYGSITVYLNQVMPESNLATPVLQIKDLDANLSLPSKSLAWSGQTSISQLTLNHRYQFFIDNIYGMDNFYAASFNPSATLSVTSSTTAPSSPIVIAYTGKTVTTEVSPYVDMGLSDVTV